MTQQFVQFGVENSQCPGDAQFAGAGLTGAAAAVDGDRDIDRGELAGLIQGIEHLEAVFLGREIIFDRAAVDLNFAGAGFEADSGDGGFAATCGDNVAGGLFGWGRGRDWGGSSVSVDIFWEA